MAERMFSLTREVGVWSDSQSHYRKSVSSKKYDICHQDCVSCAVNTSTWSKFSGFQQRKVEHWKWFQQGIFVVACKP